VKIFACGEVCRAKSLSGDDFEGFFAGGDEFVSFAVFKQHEMNTLLFAAGIATLSPPSSFSME
jgi:hypothetical protein